MKTTHLSIKELAAFIGVSTDSIRRAVRKGEIPATRGSRPRYGLIYRKSAPICGGTQRPGLGHARPARRAALPAARRPISPRLVKRGRNF